MNLRNPAVALASWLLPQIANAADPQGNLKNATPSQIQNFGGGDVAAVVGIIIQAFLGFGGMLLMIFIIYGGYQWMTAGGDSSKVQKAKTLIINSIVGMILLLGSYTITVAILTALGIK